MSSDNSLADFGLQNKLDPYTSSIPQRISNENSCSEDRFVPQAANSVLTEDSFGSSAVTVSSVATGTADKSVPVDDVLAVLAVLDGAAAAQRRRWSVIPLYGGDDAATGKAAATPWRPYQQQRATVQQVQQWFVGGRHSAYGIVCGRVSHLVVLDFDDLEALDKFVQRFPDLTDTYIVRSGGRGGAHLYYSVNFYVKGQKMTGGDLKAEGGYVVGAGSVIAGRRWAVVNDVEPRSITQEELSAVLAEFALPSVPGETDPTQAAAQAQQDGQLQRQPQARAAYQAAYQTAAPAYGRNNALFWIACEMDRDGLSEQQAMAWLTELHAQQQPNGEHPHETRVKRRSEARATIASAFRREHSAQEVKARAIAGEQGGEDNGSAAGYLDNAVREALLQSTEGTRILRLLEALDKAGAKPGEALTEKEVNARVNPLGVGGWTTRQVFSSQNELLRFFRSNKSQICLAVHPQGVSAPQARGESEGAGRPGPKAKRLIIPTEAELAERLGVELLGIADPVQADDLKTVGTYRAALHREFIAREPGLYDQKLLAARLGKTVRTIQNYNKAIPVNVIPLTERKAVYYSDFGLIPTTDEYKRLRIDSKNHWLEDRDGKRYRYDREAAGGIQYRALDAMKAAGRERMGGAVVFACRRTVNAYYIGDDVPQALIDRLAERRDALEARGVALVAEGLDIPLPVLVPAQPAVGAAQQPLTGLAAVEAKAAAAVRCWARGVTQAPSGPAQTAANTTAPNEAERWRQCAIPGFGVPDCEIVNFSRALPEAKGEALAQVAYTALDDLSLWNARGLVWLMGVPVATAALKHTRRKMKTGYVKNPGGFFRKQCSLMYKEMYGWGVPLPKLPSPPKRRNRRAG